MGRMVVVCVVFALAMLSLPNVAHAQDASDDGYVKRGSVTLRDLAALSSRVAFGVTDGDRAFRWSRTENLWQEVDETAIQSVRVSCSGDLWGLMKDGSLKRKFEGMGQWNLVPTPTGVVFVDFAVGEGHAAWAVDNTGKPWYQTEFGLWNQTQADLTRVAVGCDSKVFGITRGNNLWEYVGQGVWKEVALGVLDVSIGPEMYIVDTNSDLYKWIPSAAGQTRQVRDMINMNKKVKQVSVARDGALWVIDANGSPLQHTGLITEPQLTLAEKAALEAKQGGSWQDVAGGDNAKSVCTRGTGDIWILAADGTVKFRVKGDNEEWSTIQAPEDLAQISVGCDSQTVWGVTSAATGYKTYEYQGKGNWNLYSENLLAVSVGKGPRQVWGINTNKQLVLWNPDTRSFDVQQGTDLVQLGAGCDGTVWMVTSTGKLFQRSIRTAHLRYRGDDVKQVAVGLTKTFILDTHNFLFRYRRPTDGYHEGKANWLLLHKQLVQVAVDSEDNLAGLSVSGKVVRFMRTVSDLENFNRRRVGGSLDQICMGSASTVYGLDKGVVLHYTPAKTWAVVLGITLESIACGCDGVVYGMKKAGVVYRYRSKDIGWERVPNSFMIRSIAAGKAGELWGVNVSGEPMHYNWETNQWETFKGNFDSLSLSCTGDLWGVDPQGAVWRRDELSNDWAKMGTGAKQIATGRGVYVVGTKDTLFKYDPERKTDRWVELGPIAKVAAGDDGAVWGIELSGRVVEINPGNNIPIGPEVPPLPVSNPGLDLPPPEPDQASLSNFQPGQEPELGAQDDLDHQMEAQRKAALMTSLGMNVFHTFNEGSDNDDPGNPEPYRPGGRDPDNPDPQDQAALPEAGQVNGVDPATDRFGVAGVRVTNPVDLSNPEPGSSNK